jgi:hypothetical protein
LPAVAGFILVLLVLDEGVHLVLVKPRSPAHDVPLGVGAALMAAMFQVKTMNNGIRPQAEDASALCRTCGACCSYSLEWPRFSLENDAVLDLIPPAFVDDEQGRMRCDGDRCIALEQKVVREIMVFLQAAPEKAAVPLNRPR